MRDPSGSVDLLVAGGLAVGHGAAPVCGPVDLRVSAGRALAVVGPNGSGKSTLLRTLVRLLEPLAGTVTLAGATGLGRLPGRLGTGRHGRRPGRPGGARRAGARPAVRTVGRGGGAQPRRRPGSRDRAGLHHQRAAARRRDGSGRHLAGWGLAAAPAWAAASLHGATRPDPDRSGPVVSTPMGVLPAGVGATLVQGVDVGVVGSLPLLAALVTGGPTLLLVAVQAAWALLLAAGVLVRLGRRRSPGS